MKIIYSNNTAKGAGYGILSFIDVEGTPEASGIHFSIRRGSDQQCLSCNGWQPAEILLSPLDCLCDYGTYRIEIGPEVVDNLDLDEIYRVTLSAPDIESQRGTLSVTEIQYSPATQGASIGAGRKPDKQPVHAPAPEPVVAIEQEEPLEAKVPLAPEPKEDLLSSAPPLEVPKPKEPAKGKGMLIFLLVLALLAGGFAVWKFVLHNGEETHPSTLSLKEQAHAYLSGEADPVHSVVLANQFRNEPEGADPAFLLAEYAASKGNVEGMMITADFYDPISTLPTGTIPKDPYFAYDWYAKAQQAGNAEAAEKIAKLKTWAETEAANGNKEAQDVLARMTK